MFQFMKRLLIVGLAVLAAPLLATTLAATPEFDLNPSVGFRELEGFQFEVLTFRQGDRSVTYEAPYGWGMRSGESSLVFVPEGIGQAEMVWRAVSNEDLPQPDSEAIDFYQNQAEALLPPGVEELQHTAAVEQPIRIEDFPAMAIESTYQALGRNFQATALFINAGPDQLRILVVAPEEDFPEVYDAALKSLFSMAWQ